MMVRNRSWLWVGEKIVNEPFRVIEMLISVPLFLYGIYLLTPSYLESLSPAFKAQVGDVELTSEIQGVLYFFAALALFAAARTGVRRARRVSTMSLFIAMLYSSMFRVLELGFTVQSVLLFYIIGVVAAVDFLHLVRWGPEFRRRL